MNQKLPFLISVVNISWPIAIAKMMSCFFFDSVGFFYQTKSQLVARKCSKAMSVLEISENYQQLYHFSNGLHPR